MKICLVTAFPPSRHPLTEYGFHLARELNRKPGVSLTVLGDQLTAPAPELSGYSVVRCWDFDRASNLRRLLKTIRTIKPDVVWYNLAFASFGVRPFPIFVCLTAPALTRLCGYQTHVTLHQLMETVDFADAGVSAPRIYRFAGTVATHLLLSANSLSVLLPTYRRILSEKYRRGRVSVRSHGVLFDRPEAPDFSQRGNPVHRVLAFGKWGTYKRIDLLVGAFKKVADQFPSLQLLIAGGEHPKAKGYIAGCRKAFGDDSRIRFLGYVDESDIPGLFQSASVAVMPYSSSAGSSGVAHLACAHGVPILASDIADFHELTNEEGVAIEFFEVGNMDSLAERLLGLLQSPAKLRRMAQQNFTAALQMSMPTIVEQYVSSFEMQQRIAALKAAARLRRSPRWMPFRSLLGRRVGRKFGIWNAREQEPA
jgi:glycosyltransferase involved in cell wall biosynthesis